MSPKCLTVDYLLKFSALRSLLKLHLLRLVQLDIGAYSKTEENVCPQISHICLPVFQRDLSHSLFLFLFSHITFSKFSVGGQSTGVREENGIL